MGPRWRDELRVSGVRTGQGAETLSVQISALQTQSRSQTQNCIEARQKKRRAKAAPRVLAGAGGNRGRRGERLRYGSTFR